MTELVLPSGLSVRIIEEIDPDVIPDDQVVKVFGDLASKLVPVDVQNATWEIQDGRRKTWPFILYRLSRRMLVLHQDQEVKINAQRGELIAVRKEMSKLKREKKIG